MWTQSSKSEFPMAVRIRLKRMGRKKAPHYRVVVADGASPRDGRFVESLGYYKPLSTPARLVLDLERVDHWVGKGATPSHTVKSLISRARNGGDEKIAVGEEDADAKRQAEQEALAAKRAAEKKAIEEAEAARKAEEAAAKKAEAEAKAAAEAEAAAEAAEEETADEEPAAEASEDASEADASGEDDDAGEEEKKD